MSKHKLLNLLNSYNPVNLQEIEYKKNMLNFLNKHSDCFERSNISGHFTASCLLENCDGTKFLLTKHRKLGMWLQLGGHADGDSDLLNVALKEAEEESGINDISCVSDEIFDLSVHAIPEYKCIPAHFHYDVRFFLKAREDDKFVISDESTDLQWFSADEQIPSDNQELLRLIEKWKIASARDR